MPACRQWVCGGGSSVGHRDRLYLLLIFSYVLAHLLVKHCLQTLYSLIKRILHTFLPSLKPPIACLLRLLYPCLGSSEPYQSGCKKK